MKVIDTREYVSVLKQLTDEDGKSACGLREIVWHHF